jgi:hydroxyacyl-ACP dehydratase HTD2-like protein with hotdog domain
MAHRPEDIAALAQELPDLAWITDEAQIARLSQDFSWFSPVLKRQLQDKRGDIAVRPKTEDEIRRVVAACARRGVPITVRGSGTGNYGQIVPLHGGLILDLSGCNAFLWAQGGAGRAQAGIRLGDFDKAAQPLGWELRWQPSTFRAATLGGLYGGGFGGAGSITYGPIAAAGNVLGARVMSVEPEPQIVELRGAEALLVHHKWGTNGIVLELEIALAPALPWVEMIACFESLPAAMDFCMTLHGATPGIVKKELALMAAPIPEYFTVLAEHLPQGRHAVLMLVVASSEPATRELVAAHGGSLTYRKDQAEVRKSNRTLVEYCWNHTTLQALKVGTPLPPLWHWLYFLPLHRQSEIGADGHASAAASCRRCRCRAACGPAASSSSARRCRVWRRGAAHARPSPTSPEARAAAARWCSSRCATSCAQRCAPIPPWWSSTTSSTARPSARRRGAAAAGRAQRRAWQREIVPDEVLLFRYSALTFNGHRIHYDRRYVTEVEGYPGLVVHGPLIATLLLDLLRRQAPEADWRLQLQGRAAHLRPAPVPRQRPPLDGKTVQLWAQDHEGWLTMDATATLREARHGDAAVGLRAGLPGFGQRAAVQPARSAATTAGARCRSRWRRPARRAAARGRRR